MNHTPMPWKAIYHKVGNDVQHGLAGFSIQAKEKGIAYNIAQEENAEFIVRACNAYEDLVEALKAICNDESQIVKFVCDGEYRKGVSNLIDLGREALAKTEVKS